MKKIIVLTPLGLFLAGHGIVTAITIYLSAILLSQKAASLLLLSALKCVANLKIRPATLRSRSAVPKPFMADVVQIRRQRPGHFLLAAQSGMCADQ